MCEGIVVIAFGSTGDVLPIVTAVQELLLSKQSKETAPVGHRVLIFTSDCHRYLFAPVLKNHTERVFFHGIDRATVSTSEYREQFYSKDYFEDLCNTISEEIEHVPMIITNLFALEGWILSVAIGAGCIIIHPTFPPSACPSHALRALKITQPTRFATLNRLDTSSQECSTRDGEDHKPTSCWDFLQFQRFVQWVDYEQWLWPTLTHEYDLAIKFSMRLRLQLEAIRKQREFSVVCSLLNENCCSAFPKSFEECEETALAPIVVISQYPQLLGISSVNTTTHRWRCLDQSSCTGLNINCKESWMTTLVATENQVTIDHIFRDSTVAEELLWICKNPFFLCVHPEKSPQFLTTHAKVEVGDCHIYRSPDCDCPFGHKLVLKSVHGILIEKHIGGDSYLYPRSSRKRNYVDAFPKANSLPPRSSETIVVGWDFGSMTDVVTSTFSFEMLLTIILTLLDENPFYTVILIAHNNHSEWYESIVTVAESLLQHKIGGLERLLIHNGNTCHDYIAKELSVMVHHGGIGTVSCCMRNKLAQVIIPVMYDQFKLAATISEVETRFMQDNLSSSMVNNTQGFTIRADELFSGSEKAMDSLRAAVKDAIQMTATLRNATKTGSSNVVNPDLRELHQSNTDRSDSLGFQRNAQTQKVSFWVNFWENIQLLPMFSDNQYGSPVAEINLTSFEALNKIKTSFSARFTKASESEFAESNSIKQSFARSESILDHRKAQKDRDQSAICSTNLSLGDSCISEWLIPCNCKVETIQTTLDSSNNCNINSHCERFCEELIPIALYSHGSNAIEETQFLFQEIFSEKVYLQHGITVALDDLVVDIGANIGMFTVFSELLFCRNAALELICVEPALENFQLLEKNTSNFAPHATLYNVAIGNPSGNLPQRENYVWNPVIPGNCCLARHDSLLKVQQQSHMNENIFAKLSSSVLNNGRTDKLIMRNDVLLEDGKNRSAVAVKSDALGDDRYAGTSCEVWSLSQLLCEYFSKTSGNDDHEDTKVPNGQIICTPSDSSTGQSNSSTGQSNCGNSRAEESQKNSGIGIEAYENVHMNKRISLLKVDVEGSELEVLEGISIQHRKLIDQIVMETTVYLLPQCKRILEEEFNFNVVIVDETSTKSTGNVMMYARNTA